jgi:hypothetical protein
LLSTLDFDFDFGVGLVSPGQHGIWKKEAEAEAEVKIICNCYLRNRDFLKWPIDLSHYTIIIIITIAVAVTCRVRVGCRLSVVGCWLSVLVAVSYSNT